MRTAEEIDAAIRAHYNADSYNGTPALYLIAEILLDIRELMRPAEKPPQAGINIH